MKADVSGSVRGADPITAAKPLFTSSCPRLWLSFHGEKNATESPTVFYFFMKLQYNG